MAFGNASFFNGSEREKEREKFKTYVHLLQMS